MIEMIFGWMVFSVVAPFVSTTFVTKDTELFLSFSVFEPVEAHFECSHALMMMVLFTKPSAVELSTWIGDRGCPILFNALRSGTMSCAHLKSE